MLTAPENELTQQVEHFRNWAVGKEGSYGEWECDYNNWRGLYEAVGQVLKEPSLSDRAIELLLYTLARDNECEVVLSELMAAPRHGMQLAKAALVNSEPDARWQLAVFLGNQDDTFARQLLRIYMDDRDEYVSRRALLAGMPHDPEYAEHMAISRLSHPFEYTRLAAFSVLQELNSAYLNEAVALLCDDASEVVKNAVLEHKRTKG